MRRCFFVGGVHLWNSDASSPASFSKGVLLASFLFFFSLYGAEHPNACKPPNYLKIEITITVFCPPIPGCRRNILKGKNKKSKVVRWWSWQSQVGLSFWLDLEPEEVCTCFWSCMKVFHVQLSLCGFKTFKS